MTTNTAPDTATTTVIRARARPARGPLPFPGEVTSPLSDDAIRAQAALHAHYVDVVRHLEALILDRVPRLPLMPAPAPLTHDEVDRVAQLFVAGHRLADRVRAGG